MDFNTSNSSLLYKYPVGLLGLQMIMAFVRGVTAFSKSSIGGNAKPFSM